MSIERLVDCRIPSHICDIIFGFRPYEHLQRSLLEEIKKLTVQKWFQVFDSIWDNIYTRSGFSRISIDIENDYEICSLDIYESQNLETLDEQLSDLMHLDRNILYNELRHGNVYETPIITTIFISIIGDFNTNLFETEEWDMEYKCMCGRKKSFIRNDVHFLFRVTITQYWINEYCCDW